MPIIKRVPDFEEGKTFIIENVLVRYASVFQPNTTYRPEWCVLIVVPPELQAQFFEVGFRLKQEQDGAVTLRARRWVRLDDGTEMRPPEVVDADGNPWDPNVRGLVGNGSRCNVKVRAKYTTYKGVEGLSCYLEGLQICDLVPYSPNGPSFGKAAGNTAGFSGFTPQQTGHSTQPGFTPAPAQPQPTAPAQQQHTGFVPPGYAAPPPQPAPGFMGPGVAAAGGFSPPPGNQQYYQQQPLTPVQALQQGQFTPPGGFNPATAAAAAATVAAPQASPFPAQADPGDSGNDFIPPGFRGTGEDVPF